MSFTLRAAIANGRLGVIRLQMSPSAISRKIGGKLLRSRSPQLAPFAHIATGHCFTLQGLRDRAEFKDLSSMSPRSVEGPKLTPHLGAMQAATRRPVPPLVRKERCRSRRTQKWSLTLAPRMSPQSERGQKQGHGLKNTVDLVWTIAQPKARKPQRASTGGGSRTPTPLRAADFESAASAIPPLRQAVAKQRVRPLCTAPGRRQAVP